MKHVKQNRCPRRDIASMRCVQCGNETLELYDGVFIEGCDSLVKTDKDGNAHHFHVNTYVCSSCGRIEFILDKKPKYIVTKDLQMIYPS